ncbi:hypothetical protein L7F22_048728 [Adiantum nelumboides]|nr:hypothetical protein [Adiantum nelumboides]
MRLIQSRYSEFEAGIVARQDAKRSREDKMKQRPMARQSSRQGLEEAQRRGRLDLAREMQSEREYGQHADDVDVMVARQVWHTPTELFKPYYARAIARYIVERHRSKTDEAPLVIYELGAGSGALANDVLGYLAEAEPDLYERIEYRIIEISSRLAEQQRKILAKYIDEGTCKVHNESILQWTKVESRECFVIALEVLDNLTHDVVSYSTDSLAPYQAIVSIDESGDMHELWEPVSDPLIRRYLDLVSATPSSLGGSSSSSSGGGGRSWLESVPQALRKVMTNHLPFYPNLTARTFIPTGSLQLVEVLAKSFPRHNLVVSDFDRLPDAVQGINAPVVQTRLEGTMIPVTTYCVHQGFFDIFFPTDFAMLKRLHSQVTGAASGAGGEIMHHSTFLKRYAETDKTRCRDGSNPLLSWYENASWFLS